MDEKLVKALEFGNLMLTLNNQKINLKEKFYSSLDFYYNGSKFIASTELISFCSSLIQLEQDSCVLIDANDLPCMVDNLQEFTEGLLAQYGQASNEYLTKYNELKTKRTVQDIVNV
jgi:hypothetical protein